MLGKRIIDNKPLSGEAAQQVREEAHLVIKSRSQKIAKPQSDQAKHSVILNF